MFQKARDSRKGFQNLKLGVLDAVYEVLERRKQLNVPFLEVAADFDLGFIIEGMGQQGMHLPVPVSRVAVEQRHTMHVVAKPCLKRCNPPLL